MKIGHFHSDWVEREPSYRSLVRIHISNEKDEEGPTNYFQLDPNVFTFFGLFGLFLASKNRSNGLEESRIDSGIGQSIQKTTATATTTTTTTATTTTTTRKNTKCQIFGTALLVRTK